MPVQEVTQAGGARQARILGAEVAVQSARAEKQVSHVCLRPENLTISESGDLRSKVARVTYMGGKYLLETVTDCGARLFAETRARFDVGAQLGLTITTPWAFSED